MLFGKHTFIRIIGLVLLCLPVFSFAQQKPKKTKIEFSAKRTEFSKNIGKGATRLIGNVRFKHGNVEMFCDSAWLYEDQTLEAYKNVHISQGDSIHLYGDMLKYDGNTKKAELQKNIRMMDREMTLTTDLLFYDLNSHTANYTGGGKIVTADNVLTSENGYYYADAKELGFKKNVILTNPEYIMKSDTLRYNTLSKISYFHGPTTITSDDNFIYCEDGYYDTGKDLSRFSKNSYILSGKQLLRGDSLYYDRKNGLGRAKWNIFIVDSTEKVTIRGNYAEYSEKKYTSFVSGSAYMTQVYEKDTLFLGADTLFSSYEWKDSLGKSIPDTRARLLRAFRHVRIFKSDLQGKCDSLAYTYRDSVMRLFGAPVLWSDQLQITANSIQIITGGGEIKRMLMSESAFLVSAEDTARYNQIRGRIMTGYFNKNQLSKIHVEGNGQTVYYVKEKEKVIGHNKTECSTMDIYLKDNDIHKITFHTKPDGKITPLSQINPKDTYLKGFAWRGKERPGKEEVVGRK